MSASIPAQFAKSDVTYTGTDQDGEQALCMNMHVEKEDSSEEPDDAEEEARASCTGSSDPVVSAPMCYHGKGGALGLTENVDVKIDDFKSKAGHFEVSGDGIEAFTCANKPFTKDGQEISADLTDCQPKNIAITAIKYCS